ncbi:acylphosphatase [Pedobacter sp. UYP30]|uniref:acylphosphatase n=1 Tax=Pedobacter sp. UYP30 TaxID=1756400 RepID=UPI0033973E6C
MKHLKITVTGKVQGVFFRASTKAVANQMGINGFVRNEKDGSVYIEAEGEIFMVDELVTWCKEGPDGAKVEEVGVIEGELKNHKGFEILKNRNGKNC